MLTTRPSRSAQVRARLDHPVIDADGHTLELEPIFLDYLKRVGGSRMVERLKTARNWYDPFDSANLSEEERRDSWARRSAWWFTPAKNTLDRATASLPRLLHERMDELGIDFTVLYPTLYLSLHEIWDEEVRRAACRALNTFHADYYREYADRMTPAATIPMHTPQEAIEELEYAVNVLGLKTIMIAGHVRRPVPFIERNHPELAAFADRLDVYGIDSDYDYDPFWAKCVELKVAPTAHSAAHGWRGHRSPSNYMYNHIGLIATSQEALCKALFMGGVTRRFPTLNFGFLECGVGWACNLYADLIGRWPKRGPQGIQNLDPANLDGVRLMELTAQYGGELVNARLGEIRDFFDQRQPGPPVLDDWAACGIVRVEDFHDLFVPHFFFGCEADEPMNCWAFNEKVNPFGARLGAMLSSDIGHWDVTDMREVIAEAYEPVERGLITERDFRDFIFANPVKLWAGMNPDFFKGTIVEHDVERLLAGST